MILYHGSFKQFDKFEIKREFLRTDECNLAEGVGIYMADNIEFVKDYGNYIYKISINDSNISDFTNKKYILYVLKEMERQTGVKFLQYINVQELIEDIIEGEVYITTLYKVIGDILDSQESFYNKYSDLITYEDDCIFVKFKEAFNNITKNTFKYYSKDFKCNNYICKNTKDIKIIEIIEIK